MEGKNRRLDDSKKQPRLNFWLVIPKALFSKASEDTKLRAYFIYDPKL